MSVDISVNISAECQSCISQLLVEYPSRINRLFWATDLILGRPQVKNHSRFVRFLRNCPQVKNHALFDLRSLCNCARFDQLMSGQRPTSVCVISVNCPRFVTHHDISKLL